MKTNLIILPRVLKRILLALLLFGLAHSIKSQDLPAPSPNIQTLPVGSYIIPMDNFYQFNAANLFNIKAYGLVVHLLNNGVKLKWVIKAGKLKDSIDCSINTIQIWPTVIGTPKVRNLKAGPFVIYAPDTVGVSALINSFYVKNNLLGNDRPKVFKNGTAASVDIRYDLQGFLPKAAVLNDGGNEAIHVRYMEAASVPIANYSISAGRDLISGCYTFASEPHNGNTGPVVDTAIISIKDFVQYGGNFLAQCEAVVNYENSNYGRFQTTIGVTKANVNIGTNVNFFYGDLSYSQIDGAFSASAGGSIRNWTIDAGKINNEHDHVTGTGPNTGVIGASVSKLKSGKGGMVFYLGNHEYTTTSQVSINGLRMYMNAFLTPSLMPCLFYVLKMQFTNFNVDVKNGKTALIWEVTENQNVQDFQVQKSYDGLSFSDEYVTTATTKVGLSKYSLTLPVKIDRPCYFRVQSISKSKEKMYSKVIRINPDSRGNAGSLNLLQNPVSSSLAITYTAGREGMSKVNIYNSSGLMVYSKTVNCKPGINNFMLPLGNITSKGIFILEVTNSNEYLVTSFLKQ
jgi:hypothetical protein